MASFAPPIPSGPGAPPPGAAPAGPPPGLSGLVGGDPNALPQGPSPQERVANYVEQIHNIESLIDALAQDHPEAADELNQAKNALNTSMSKVAVASSTPDQIPQPPTF